MKSKRDLIVSLAVDFGLFALLVGTFLSLIDISQVFLETHVAGGDMISHPVVPYNLKKFWSQGMFWGWSQSWFGGLPMLYYYFYPIYVMAILLEGLGFSDAVSFKLMVLLVVTMVPALGYVFARRWLSPVGAFLLGTLVTAIFLNEMESRWGGNFKSVLAGQVSHQFGLVMMGGFFSYLVTKETNRFGAIATFALAILGHVYTAMFTALLLGVYLVAELIETRSWRRVWSQCQGPLLAIGMTAFFWAPFLYYRNFTVAPINNSVVPFKEMLRIFQYENWLYLLVYVGAISAVILNWAFRRKWLFAFGVLVLAGLAAGSLPFLKGTPLVHVRIPAQVYLFCVFAFILGLRDFRLPRFAEWPAFGIVALIILQSYLPIKEFDKILPAKIRQPVAEIPNWWNWNMSGIESKHPWEEAKQIWDFLKADTDSEGRVAFEYGDYNRFGSPRIFELTEVMTGKPVMEGLLLESSPNYPAYYYMSFQFNSTTWWPGFPVTVPPRNVEKGLKFFGLFNVKYFVGATDYVREEMARLGYKPEVENKSFALYRVNQDTRIANRVVGEIPVLESKTPLLQSVLNFPESLERFIEVRPGSKYVEDGIRQSVVGEQRLVPLEGAWSSDGQSYTVNGTGASPDNPQNVLFKISYFPNWKADSGEEVRIVSPNLMLVRTTRDVLSLHFRVGWVERISALIGFACLFILGWTKFLDLKKRAAT